MIFPNMNQTLESQEAMTSPPVINNQKTFTIKLDENNSLSFDIDGTWSLHEAIGALVISGLNLYSNNVTSASQNAILAHLQEVNGMLANIVGKSE
jgi:hypothetical protein